jgi:hypothetical protein
MKNFIFEQHDVNVENLENVCSKNMLFGACAVAVWKN